jgi:hypothetical protein
LAESSPRRRGPRGVSAHQVQSGTVKLVASRPTAVSHWQWALGLLIVGLAATALLSKGVRTSGATTDGVAYLSVSDLLKGRSSGAIGNEEVGVTGYWWSGSIPQGCRYPDAPPGALEVYCEDGVYGITDALAPLSDADRAWEGLSVFGAFITPWMDPNVADDWALLKEDSIAGAPIVAVGHFDDPRSSDCRAEMLKTCQDRLVLDGVISLGASVVATSAPDATVPDLPPLFATSDCAGDSAKYSFSGWTTTQNLNLGFDRPGYVFAMVASEPVLLGGSDWNADPAGSSHKFRVWGRMICISQPGDGGIIEYGSVPGDSFVEWDDGLHVAGQAVER